MRHSPTGGKKKKGPNIFPETEGRTQGERLDSCVCLDVSDVSVAEQIAAKGETNGNAKEQSGIDTVGLTVGDLLLFAFGHSTRCFMAFHCIDDDCRMPLGSTVYRARVNSRAKRLSHQKQWGDG